MYVCATHGLRNENNFTNLSLSNLVRQIYKTETLFFAYFSYSRWMLWTLHCFFGKERVLYIKYVLKLCIIHISGQIAAVFFTTKVPAILINQLTLINYYYTNFGRISFISDTYDLWRRLYRNYNFKHVVASRFVDVHKGWQTNEDAHCISIMLVLIMRTMGIIEHAYYDHWIFTQICCPSFRHKTDSATLD